VHTGQIELEAELAGKLAQHSLRRFELPALGDWVAIQPPQHSKLSQIKHVFQRRNKMSRKLGGKYREEVIVAANIDTLFLISSLDSDFNIRRIERDVVLAWENQIRPVILLNKLDLCNNPKHFVNQVESIAFGVPVYSISVLQNTGFEPLSQYLQTGQTCGILGATGCGKTSFVKCLLGDLDIPQTSSQVLFLPSGSLLIDTSPLNDDSSVSSDEHPHPSYDDIEEIISNCRFRDCQHENEPGCAVRAALEDGTLDMTRYRNYLKMKNKQSGPAGFDSEKPVQNTKRDLKKRAIEAKAKAKAKERERDDW
jgi:ribosome biogenesis GTPase